MCGIFGLICTDHSITENEYGKELKQLFLLSETRGKEAAGICAVSESEIRVCKSALRAKEFVNTNEYASVIKSQFDASNAKYIFAMGHSRMVTNGDAGNDTNNQPVIKENFVCIHNGIIVNDNELWNNHTDIKRNSEVDTEILLGLINKYYEGNMISAFQQSMEEIKGSVSVALVSKYSNELLLFTNIGSLYFLVNLQRTQLIFASERYIIEKYLKDRKHQKEFVGGEIVKISPDTGILINLKTLESVNFNNVNKTDVEMHLLPIKKIEIIKVNSTNKSSNKVHYNCEFNELNRLMKIDNSSIRKLKRCKKCLLPETFPGISFDDDGVCSICHGYRIKKVKGEKQLIDDMTNTGKVITNSRYDCLLPISGGRDSCYCLHYAVKELGLNPVAYTYDWGMVTDLARRNIQRMCSELKVEHVLISADISKKRNNIRMNVEAWLKDPNVATVPLFMAGDKQFFYYAQMLKKQMRISNILFGMNSLEETNFKVGFTGIREKHEDGVFYNLSKTNKLNMCFYYGKQFLKNPAYINTSLLDTVGGFFSYYMLPKDYIQLFDYIKWDESQVVKTILDKYDWETAKDTNGTWRIGDGTAPFYNYIYYRICGFSEYDTFRSNQIREGILDREVAMANIYEENAPRVEAFKWYCDTIGIDAINAVRKINNQKTLYNR